MEFFPQEDNNGSQVQRAGIEESISQEPPTGMCDIKVQVFIRSNAFMNTGHNSALGCTKCLADAAFITTGCSCKKNYSSFMQQARKHAKACLKHVCDQLTSFVCIRSPFVPPLQFDWVGFS